MQKEKAAYQYNIQSIISCSPGVTSLNNKLKINNKKILIFGGTGSLGNKLNEKYPCFARYVSNKQTMPRNLGCKCPGKHVGLLDHLRTIKI